MPMSCEAEVRFGDYEGRVSIDYSESENRFTLRKTGSVGGRAVAGAMFGALGRAVYEGLASGKEVGSFHASEIQKVATSQTKRQVVYYLYGSDAQPYEFTIGKKEKMNNLLQQLYADRMSEVVAQQGGIAAPTPPAPPVAPPSPTQEANPVLDMPPTMADPPFYDVGTAQQTLAAQFDAQPRTVNVILCLRTGPLAGNNFTCPQGNTIFLGRDPARCNIPLPQYPNVSAMHCRLDLGEDMVVVTDLNSTNGTCVNGTWLAPNQSVAVSAGGTVMLASENCVFQIYFE